MKNLALLIALLSPLAYSDPHHIISGSESLGGSPAGVGVLIFSIIQESNKATQGKEEQKKKCRNQVREYSDLRKQQMKAAGVSPEDMWIPKCPEANRFFKDPVKIHIR